MISNCYACPYCESTDTMVNRTVGFKTYILRIRKCRHCGKSHETIEVNSDRVQGFKDLIFPRCVVVEEY